jgi:hypothetical protein
MTPFIAPRPRFAGAVLAVTLAIPTACRDTPSLEPVGGGWYTHYTSAYNPDAHGSESLYRKTSTGTIRVEQGIRGILHFYPPDCVVYDTQRDLGVIYAACGDHTPFAVASYAVWKGGGYRLDPDGLAFPGDARVSDGHAVATVSRIPIDSIRAYAEAQPIMHEGWTPAPDGHRMRPVITEESVIADAGSGARTTALFEAVRRQQREVVDALLRDGAAVDATNHSGMTPLHLAAGFDSDTAIVLRLIDAGANLEAADNSGMTPLLVAALTNQNDVVRVLLAKGADPCKKDDKGRTIRELGGPENVERIQMADAALERCR